MSAKSIEALAEQAGMQYQIDGDRGGYWGGERHLARFAQLVLQAGFPSAPADLFPGGEPLPIHPSQSFEPEVLKWHSLGNRCMACEGRICSFRATALAALAKEARNG